MRALVTGHAGMLGGLLLKTLRAQGVDAGGVDKADLDLCDAGATVAFLGRHRPQIIYHCAAYTNVDGAETDEAAALAVNRDAVKTVADWCNASGSLLVHFSTDYVFDGRKNTPYTEDDAPAPLGKYARSKYEGERAALASGCDLLLVRTAWLFGAGGKNFVKTILEKSRQGNLRVVNDQRGSPTHTVDLVEGLLALVEKNARGIFHVTNAGDCTWHELAEHVVKTAGRKAAVAPVSTAEYPLPARRPAYSVLGAAKFAALTGLTLRPWRDAVKQYILYHADAERADFKP